ncbi:M48 metallopeptidase family protein [Nocardioides alcanivorans]|uniref:M48 metallopeptidase family protein n=1 Tax=Nocardioides alcanivorans TaxID=2897352 RepID=UPI001F221985|nr:YgjP-like metallopeptidase domain-containing protein [Nocardioides alcanivorans]
MGSPKVEVRRSSRRRRTVSAYREGDTVVVLIPATMSKKAEQEWVATMVQRLERRERKRKPPDEALLARALDLSDRYLGGLADPESVRWVDNQNARWGSCTPGDKTIRISSRLKGMPLWVLDYVVLHEITHLLEPSHDEKFWAWVNAYPKAERAKGYLEGWSAAREEEPTDAD